EDVIRDRNVTGVQTCALPISFRRSIWWSSSALPTSAPSPANRRGISVPCKAFQAGGKSVTCTRQTAKEVRRKNIKVSAAPFEARSEERRVGKESRRRPEREIE